jgi:hypothetical protein
MAFESWRHNHPRARFLTGRENVLARDVAH